MSSLNLSEPLKAYTGIEDGSFSLHLESFNICLDSTSIP